jgi:hypothetical protein
VEIAFNETQSVLELAAGVASGVLQLAALSVATGACVPIRSSTEMAFCSIGRRRLSDAAAWLPSPSPAPSTLVSYKNLVRHDCSLGSI